MNDDDITTYEELINWFFIQSDYSTFKDRTKRLYEVWADALRKHIPDLSAPFRENTREMSCDLFESLLESYTPKYASRIVLLLARMIHLWSLKTRIPVLNAYKLAKTVPHDTNQVLWTYPQVAQFLEVAYSKWEWRNVGIIVQLCYEWVQRPLTIVHLLWEDLDLDNSIVKLNQMNGSSIYMEIEDATVKLLDKQKEDFNFQDYVVPTPKPFRGQYLPYRYDRLSHDVADIRTAARLPKDLRINALRQTGIMELYEAGTDKEQIADLIGYSCKSSVQQPIKAILKRPSDFARKRRDRARRYKKEH